MAHTFSFQLVTPEKTILTEELVSLTCPTTLGQITILPGHIPLVATLISGELHAKTLSSESFLHVSGGFVEVRTGNEVVVLADAAEHHYEIDVQKAEEAKIRAEKTMQEKTISTEDYARAAASLQQSLARINVARKHAHRRSPLTQQGNFNE